MLIIIISQVIYINELAKSKWIFELVKQASKRWQLLEYSDVIVIEEYTEWMKM